MPLDPGDPGLFPPLQAAAVVALVCEYVSTLQRPATGPADRLPGTCVIHTTAPPTAPLPGICVVHTTDPAVLAFLPPSTAAVETIGRLLDTPLPLAAVVTRPLPPPRGRARVHLTELLAVLTEQLSFPVRRTTLWRLLHEHALKPWQFRYWIFPRDPQFVERAGPVLDLYARCWEGQPLGDDEYVLGGDEKTSIQARIRCHGTVAAQPGQPARVEFEYERGGALQYLALRDVHRGTVFGACEAKTGIVPFDRLVAQVMAQEPYRSAKRVFLIVDNGSSHRGQASIRRLQQRHPNLVLVHLPVHASWLNQVEIYFSILQRLVLQPNDFASLTAAAEAILGFQERYNATARPFAWHFGRKELQALAEKLRRFPLPVAAPKKRRGKQSQRCSPEQPPAGKIAHANNVPAKL